MLYDHNVDILKFYKPETTQDIHRHPLPYTPTHREANVKEEIERKEGLV